MKVYLTKYALVRGIEEVNEGHWCVCGNRQGTDWHRTILSAKARAESMRTNKILLLKKQIAKLEALKF